VEGIWTGEGIYSLALAKAREVSGINDAVLTALNII
jgi:hypothetical protein